MITRPEINAVNAFDAMEWLELHHCKNLGLIGTLDIKQRGDRDPIREFQVSRFLAWCDDYQEQVEEHTMYYLAGPYNDFTDESSSYFPIDVNIEVADIASFDLWEKGISVFTPHLNTRGFHTPRPSVFSSIQRQIEESVFTNSLIDNLYRFSGLILLPNWKYSNGTKAEITKALEIGKPIFHYGEVMIDIWRPVNKELEKCSIKENG